MESPKEPSLIQYARYHGIARDLTATDPVDFVERASTTATPLPQDVLSKFKDQLHNTHQRLYDELQHEKLDIQRDGARFLSSVIRDSRTEDIDIPWHDLLPAWSGLDDFKLDVPLFPMDQDYNELSSLPRLQYHKDDVNIQPLQSFPQAPKHVQISDSLLEGPHQLMKDIMSEKLDCAKDAFLVLQNVKECSQLPLEDLESLLQDMILSTETATAPHSPPLVLYPTDCAHSEDFLDEIFPQEIVVEGDTGTMSVSKVKYMNNESITTGRTFPNYEPTSGPELSPVAQINLEEMSEACAYASEDSMTSISNEQISPTLNPTVTCTSPLINAVQQSDIMGRDYTAITPPSLPIRKSAGKDIVTSLKDQKTKSTMCSLQADITETPAVCDSDVFDSLMNPVNEKPCVSTESTSVTDLEPTKVKRKHQDDPDYLLNGRIKKDKSLSSGTREMKASSASSFHPTLGSLALFMETRGHTSGSAVLSKSPYFCSDVTPYRAQEKICGVHSRTTSTQEIDATVTTGAQSKSAIQLQKYPKFQKIQRGAFIFMSTTLLKSHLRLVQYLEAMDPPPAIIYRDYDSPIRMQQSHLKGFQQHRGFQELPREADIIVSPTTGIILTTPQETTQLYLPGHKSTDPRIPRVEMINSPLREKIFRLAVRYEYLYIFVCYSEASARNLQDKNSGWAASKRELASLTSLNAFCNSMSAQSKIVPLAIPSPPETISGWILYLTQRHDCILPAEPPQPLSLISGNAGPRLGPDQFMEQDTGWEHFLRRAGLNPYAAHAILATLRSESRCSNDALPVNDPICGALSTFVEMTPADRRHLLIDLVGERVLERVGRLVERNWQCDWALELHDHPNEVSST